MDQPATTFDETGDPMTATRRLSWAEHPLSIPTNLCWVTWGLFTLIIVAIDDLPEWLWIVDAAWLLGCFRLTWQVFRTRDVAIAPPTRAASGPVEGTSLYRDAMHRLGRNQLATLSMGVIVLMMLACFGQRVAYELFRNTPIAASPDSFFALHLDHTRINEKEELKPPDKVHWFGTDALGRDLFARTLYGGHISFMVGIVATAVSLVIGVTWGASAGYFGGRVDDAMMRIVDVLYGLPFMFLVILILALVNGLYSVARQQREHIEAIDVLYAEGKPLEAQTLALEKEVNGSTRWAVWLADNLSPIMAMFLALGLVSWLTMARITRGQVLSLRQRDYVMAARSVGARSGRIIARHIVPNLLGPIIVYSTLTIPAVMLEEAFLSYLGLGVSEPDCSWGSLAKDGLAALNVLKPYWWLLTYPAAAISLALFSFNFIGDGLRDALDPKGKR
ncbi:Oligopeptide transport system permease protein OppC [Planctomycetes bacterium Pan216]|uniref:Oligopeptide transport system permease protein OppC n=1 Tax=Kolteria novifilia TaxID=2527975 RepID=A0A518B266_9BACT|nr:Oligopeptide transport system permease protein OppC [Planctomycetes bacterium Pan216]